MLRPQSWWSNSNDQRRRFMHSKRAALEQQYKRRLLHFWRASCWKSSICEFFQLLCEKFDASYDTGWFNHLFALLPVVLARKRRNLRIPIRLVLSLDTFLRFQGRYESSYGQVYSWIGLPWWKAPSSSFGDNYSYYDREYHKNDSHLCCYFNSCKYG